MGIIDTKFFTDENSVEMKTDIYENGMTVTQCANQPEPVEPVEPEPTQLDRIEEQVNTIANGTTSENTDAIDALLGI